MTENKYAGTTGLTPTLGLKRLYEILDKQPLGSKDEEFYNEARHVIEQDMKKIIRDAKNWNKAKHLLSAKQLLKVFDEE